MEIILIIIGGILVVAVFVLLIFYKKIFSKKNQSVSSASLRNEKVKSDIIINSIEDGVILIAADKTIQLFNLAAEKITGWNSKETIGLDYNLVIKLIDDKGNTYPDNINPFSTVFKKAAPVRDNKAVIVSRSEKQIALNISVSPLLDSNNQVSGVVGIIRDVGKERNEESQRADFISTASHEMRTPVAAIEGYLALALNPKVSKIDDKARDYLDKAHSSTQQLGRLFQDLLTSARAEDGRISNHPVLIEVGEFLEKLSHDLKFNSDKKGLQMEFITGTTDSTIDASSSNNKMVRPFYYIEADPERIREVVTNIFENAVKYTDAGKISLGITGNREVVQIYVKDVGSGIAPEDIPHLFQKFYRVDNSATRSIGGTGLGLFICRKIVEMYNGRIWVESELNKGSIFYINLPRANATNES